MRWRKWTMSIDGKLLCPLLFFKNSQRCRPKRLLVQSVLLAIFLASKSKLQPELNQARKIDRARDDPEVLVSGPGSWIKLTRSQSGDDAASIWRPELWMV